LPGVKGISTAGIRTPFRGQGAKKMAKKQGGRGQKKRQKNNGLEAKRREQKGQG